MKKILLLLVALFTVTTSAMAQIVTTSPAILQESSANVVLTYHADQGNKGLMGVTSSTGVYAHVGVITNKSNGSGDWKYAPTWGDNSAKYKLTYVSTNTWKLNIGDIRTYFGITDASETVEQIALVFRTADNSKEGKTATGGDIFVEVHPEGFQMQFTSSAESNILTSTTNSIKFNIETTSAAKLEILINDNVVSSVASASSLAYTHKFSSLGNYDVVARATSGSNVVTKTLSYCYPNNSTAANYPGGVPKMGAVANADGTVTFCLAAPGKNNVMIVGAWDDYKALDKNVMKYQDYNGNRYFWTTISGLDKTKAYPYYYAVDATIKVGDPYAKLVLDPWSDKWISEDVYPNMPKYPTDKVDGIMLAVYKGNIDEYNWKITDFEAPAAKDLIIYEMLFRDFTGTEGATANDEGKMVGAADGTVRQAIEKIPYIKSLGVNAVELMPIMEFNGNNSWGYNTNFYFAPDKAYGTHDDYREFIDKCHQEGIAVILDIVFNQSDGLHPWYQMYPISSNPFYNENAPHAYSVLNDWNQDNALVKQQWKDVLQYWLKEFNVDGYRFDLVKGLGSNSSYGNGTEAYNQSRVDNMKQFHAWIKEVKPNAYHINENLAGADEENAMANDGQLNWSNINEGSCQYAMAFSDNSNCNGFYAPNYGRNWGSTVSYAESHDEERVSYKVLNYGNSATLRNTSNNGQRMTRLGSLAAQMLTAPGPKMIWQFQELGNEQTTKKNGNENDTDPKGIYWNYLNDANRKGLYDSYSELCWLRRSNPDLFSKSATITMKCTASDWSAGRYTHLVNGGYELIMFANTYTAKKTFSNIPFNSSSDSNYKIASKSYNKDCTFSASSGTVTLPANSYIVIVNNSVDTGVDEIIADNQEMTKVYGGQGEIVIDGEYNDVRIYSISGQYFNTLSVPAGLYIVNVDGNTTKVIVK